jgi:RNAse (barnase) inhibitor barstar
MDDWAALFRSYLKSGVYIIKPGTDIGIIKNAAAENGLEFLYVDLKKVTGKKGLLKKFSLALNFPDYFGMNWDALGDCLTDMSWKPAAGYVLLFSNFRVFAEKNPEDMKIAGNIFDSSANYWKQKKVPFYIILSEKVSSTAR